MVPDGSGTLMCVGVNWRIVVGITSSDKGMTGIVPEVFEFVVGVNGTTIGVGLQAVSKRIRTGMIWRLFMAYLRHDGLARITLRKLINCEFSSKPDYPSVYPFA
jgi:hypothetical protein